MARRRAGLKLSNPIKRWLSRRPERLSGPAGRQRGPATHIVILDGTMSSLREGYETNAGITFKLLTDSGQSHQQMVYYEKGIQWRDWRGTADVVVGRGVNRQIKRAYGWLANRYRPGDRIVLLGYSRGAYAVRSLAGVIDRVGLVAAQHATVRMIRQAYRHYECGPDTPAAQAFAARYCVPEVRIAMVGVWDTVKALGLRLPIVWRFAKPRHQFHNHALGDHIAQGFHALALDETRAAYAPVLWSCPEGWSGQMEQVWFRGTHGDIGGQLGGFTEARPLANIPLVWMLERLEACPVDLPEGWRARFPMDPEAPSVGTFQGYAKLFLNRRRRVVGRDPSESLHPTATGHPMSGHLEPVAKKASA
ncbi:DUF2235 domain-containing protein [Alphaproteobacteria bacterium KMM 3653]|uniref:DUF2235 domain-containing protein n=1 Tax=Harenicola maris TaxID=2841044 RepID=A0AAP2CLK9_9RHOB|nr:DUF2235 domain-containing protein [Harenicola maris]